MVIHMVISGFLHN